MACDGKCVRTNNDADNCGYCGHVCQAPNNYCSQYQCHSCDFGAGQGLCPLNGDPEITPATDMYCSDLPNDAQNCNRCGNICSSGHCAQGGCCAADSIVCGGECVFYKNSTEHCGGCDVACTPPHFCRFGQCSYCPTDEGYGICPDPVYPGQYTCAFIESDWTNCGGCGNVCDSHQCGESICCPTGYIAPVGGPCQKVS